MVIALGAPYDTVNPGRMGMLFLHSDGTFDTLFIGGWLGSAEYKGWLHASRPNSDSLVFSYEPADTDLATYCPESRLFSNIQHPSSHPNPSLIRQSSSGEHLLGVNNGAYILDEKAIDWGNQNPYSLGSASFSPDEKHIAFGVGQLGGLEWIYNISDLLSGKPVSPIAQLYWFNRYCLGSERGAWGEFVSDTSLVVSLHGDPTTGAQCNLYEVNFNGDIIRKLTSY